MNVKAIAVAALVTVAMPAAVFAQDAPSINPGADNPAMASGSASAVTDFDAFMQGMSAADFTSATSAIDIATTFNVVKISTLANADATKLQDAIAPHEADIASLSARLEANAQAKAALDAAGVAASDVVWVDTDASGGLTLYVNDLG